MILVMFTSPGTISAPFQLRSSYRFSVVFTLCKGELQELALQSGDLLPFVALSDTPVWV